MECTSREPIEAWDSDPTTPATLSNRALPLGHAPALGGHRLSCYHRPVSVLDPLGARSLRDQATRLALRACLLAERAQHPFSRDQITLIGLAARDAFGWSVEADGSAERLAAVAASLGKLRDRLAELEELVDAHPLDAVPPEHA